MKYDSDDTIFFIHYFYTMTKWDFQMPYYCVSQSYYGGSFRLESLVAQNHVALLRMLYYRGYTI
jgi:hypothetical protein